MNKKPGFVAIVTFLYLAAMAVGLTATASLLPNKDVNNQKGEVAGAVLQACTVNQTLYWSGAPPAQSYFLDWKPAYLGYGNDSFVGVQLAPGTSSYTFYGMQPNTAYLWRLWIQTGYNFGEGYYGLGGPNSWLSFTTEGCPAPPPPPPPPPPPAAPTVQYSNLFVNNQTCAASDVNASFSWSYSFGNYDQQYIDWNTTGSDPWNGTQLFVGSTSANIGGISQNAGIYWRINLHSTDDNQWHPSPVQFFQSQNCTPTTPPPPPGNTFPSPSPTPPPTGGFNNPPQLSQPVFLPCENGRVGTYFKWTTSGFVTDQYLDLSLEYNGWDNGPGHFINAHLNPSDQTFAAVNGAAIGPLDSGKRHYWRITNLINGQWVASPTGQFDTPACAQTSPPGAPGSISASGIPQCSDNMFFPTLSWQAVDGASGYKIIVRTTSNNAQTSDMGNVTSAQVGNPQDPQNKPGLNPNFTYYWTVLAYNLNGEGPAYSPEQQILVPLCAPTTPPPTTPPGQPPAQPPTTPPGAAATNLSADHICYGQSLSIFFHWKPSYPHDDQYLDIKHAGDANFLGIKTTGEDGASFEVPNVDQNIAHEWRINTRVGSVWSPTQWYPISAKSCTTTPPTQPPPSTSTPVGATNLIETGHTKLTNGDWQVNIAWNQWQWTSGAPDAVWLDVATEGGFINYAIQAQQTDINAQNDTFVVAPGHYWIRINTHFPGFVQDGQDRGWYPSNVVEINLDGAAPPPPAPEREAAKNLTVDTPGQDDNGLGQTLLLWSPPTGDVSTVAVDLSKDPAFGDILNTPSFDKTSGYINLLGQLPFAAEISPATVKELNIAGLPDGTTYIRINTLFGTNEWQPSATVSITVTGTTPPPTCNSPKTFSLVGPEGQITTNTPGFSWTASANHTQYFIDLSDDNFNTWWYIAVDPNQTTSPWSVWNDEKAGGKSAPNTGLIPGKDYQWKMSAMNACPSGNVFTPSAQTFNVKYDPGTPTPIPDSVFAATDLNINPPGGYYNAINGIIEADFLWNYDEKNDGIPGLLQWVYLKYDDGPQPQADNSIVFGPFASGVDGFQITDPPGLTPDKTHVWRVNTCVNCTSNSVYSAEHRFKTIPIPVGTPPPPDLPPATPPDKQVPDQPALISPQSNTTFDMTKTSNITFSWSSDSKATNYWLDVSQDSNFGNWWGCNTQGATIGWINCNWLAFTQGAGGANLVGDQDVPLNELYNGRYYWRVAATNDNGFSPPSLANYFNLEGSNSPGTAQPLPDEPEQPPVDIQPVPPTTPTPKNPAVLGNVSDETCTNDKVSLAFNWTPASGGLIDEVWLDVATNPSFTGNYWAATNPPLAGSNIYPIGSQLNNPSWSIPPLDKNTDYYWRINTKFADGTWKESQTSQFRTQDCAVGGPPQAQIPPNVENARVAANNCLGTGNSPQVTFSWTPVGKPSVENIYVDISADNFATTSYKLLTNSTVPQSTYTWESSSPLSSGPIKTPQPGTTYQARMIYWNSSGFSQSHTQIGEFKTQCVAEQPQEPAPPSVPVPQLGVASISCANNNYAVGFSWIEQGNDWYLDISPTSAFPQYWNKDVSSQQSTTAPYGFSSPNGLGPLQFKQGETYYWRIWNTQTWSEKAQFTIQGCPVTATEDFEITVDPQVQNVKPGEQAQYKLMFKSLGTWSQEVELNPGHGQAPQDEPSLRVSYDVGASNKVTPITIGRIVFMDVLANGLSTPGEHKFTVGACGVKTAVCHYQDVTLDVTPSPYNLSTDGGTCPNIIFSWDEQGDPNTTVKIFNDENLTSQRESLIITGLQSITWNKASSAQIYHAAVFYNNLQISNKVSSSCQAATGGGGSGSFTIPTHNTSIQVIKSGDARIANNLNTDYVINSALQNGWNPAFITALWIEESGATTNVGYCPYQSQGCYTKCHGSIQANLSCFYADSSYVGLDWSAFANRYCGVPGCTNNPNFLKNIRDVYNSIVSPVNKVELINYLALRKN